jgi:hypothetical protein
VSSTVSGPAYDFSHAKLRAIVYEETNMARRRLLHRRVAEALSTRAQRLSGAQAGPNSPLAAVAGQIAQHFQLAGRDSAAADDAMAQFCAHFPGDRDHRWVRDLAADVLHNVDPERYPLMCRWVWDARANTGVLREIWHAEDVDHITIHVPDGYATFVVLREELSQYVTTNGVYRDVLQYVDLLTAQVYGEYITEQGGSYLRSDFAQPQDPMLHTRRMLGLDVAPDGRTKLKAVDGDATIVDPPRLAN